MTDDEQGATLPRRDVLNARLMSHVDESMREAVAELDCANEASVRRASLKVASVVLNVADVLGDRERLRLARHVVHLNNCEDAFSAANAEKASAYAAFDAAKHRIADASRFEAAETLLRVLLTEHPSSKRARVAREQARALLDMGAPAKPEKPAKVEVRHGQEWTKDGTTVRITSQPFGGRVSVATVTEDGRLIRRRSTFVTAFTNTPAGYRLTKEAPEVTP